MSYKKIIGLDPGCRLMVGAIKYNNVHPDENDHPLLLKEQCELIKVSYLAFYKPILG